MNLSKTLLPILVVGLLATLLIPFIVSNSMLFPFITGKAFTFRILVEVLFVLWIALILGDRKYVPKPSFISWAVLGFLIVVGLADVFGVMTYKSFWSNFERMEGLLTIIHLAIYFFIASSVMTTEKVWRWFFNTSIVASVVMAFYGFLQLAGKIVINQGGVRVDGTFGNATYLAVYMLFNLFFALWLLVRSQNIGPRIFYAAAMACQFIIIYKTATRGAIIGLLGGLFVTTLLIVIFERNSTWIRKTAIAALVALVLVIGGFFLMKDTEFVRGSRTLARFASISVSQIKTQGRYYIWPMAWSGVKERPVLGWGQENFNYVFNKYYDPKLYNQEPWFDRTHNIFLDWLISAGILGLASYLSLYAALFLYLWKNKNDFSTTEKAILTGLILAYGFQNMFVFDNLISYLMFFSILAYVHSVVVRNREAPNWWPRVNNFNVQWAVTVVVAIAVVFGVYFLNVKPILANREIIKIVQERNPANALDSFYKIFSYDTFANTEAREQLYSAVFRVMASGNQIPAEIGNKFVTLAKEQMLKQVEATPNDARPLLFMGSMLNRLGQSTEALGYLSRAHEASPGKQGILFELGMTQISLGDYQGAFETEKKAYELAPENPEAKVMYAVTAVYVKDFQLAANIIKDIDQKVLITDDRLVIAYSSVGQYSEMLKILELRRNLLPNDPQSYFSLAAGYLQAGQRQKSIETLRQAAVVDPKLKDQVDYYIKEIQAGRNP